MMSSEETHESNDFIPKHKHSLDNLLEHGIISLFASNTIIDYQRRVESISLHERVGVDVGLPVSTRIINVGNQRVAFDVDDGYIPTLQSTLSVSNVQ